MVRTVQAHAGWSWSLSTEGWAPVSALLKTATTIEDLFPKKPSRKWEVGSAASAQQWRGALSPCPFLPLPPGMLPWSHPRNALGVGPGLHHQGCPPSLSSLSNDICCTELSTSLWATHPGLRRSHPSHTPWPLGPWQPAVSAVLSAVEWGTGRDPFPGGVHLEGGRKHGPVVGCWQETSWLWIPAQRRKWNQTQFVFVFFSLPCTGTAEQFKE